jgi:hypothetical protein
MSDLYEFLGKNEEEVRADISKVLKNYEFITFVGVDGEPDVKMVEKRKDPTLEEL